MEFTQKDIEYLKKMNQDPEVISAMADEVKAYLESKGQRLQAFRLDGLYLSFRFNIWAQVYIDKDFCSLLLYEVPIQFHRYIETGEAYLDEVLANVKRWEKTVHETMDTPANRMRETSGSQEESQDVD
jgi:hypothetical protein